MYLDKDPLEMDGHQPVILIMEHTPSHLVGWRNGNNTIAHTFTPTHFPPPQTRFEATFLFPSIKYAFHTWLPLCPTMAEGVRPSVLLAV